MKTRSLAALTKIRTRIARRRRASADAWAHNDSSRAVGRFGMDGGGVWPSRRKEAPPTARDRLAGQVRDRPVSHDREIQSLSDRSGAPPTEVRALFVAEFARLKIGAKVGSYLAVLTQSNVRGMLRRKTLAAEAARTTADLSRGP
jgi:hypothetical protein